MRGKAVKKITDDNAGEILAYKSTASQGHREQYMLLSTDLACVHCSQEEGVQSASGRLSVQAPTSEQVVPSTEPVFDNKSGGRLSVQAPTSEQVVSSTLSSASSSQAPPACLLS